ncbi:hypothetical protein HELRODRAFT_191032 [Helobdella robusta]|uniref:Mediator of RNA polymerase II transcription subunit 24 n=1 Tax=Helobdella robusta TaxID=6412 RepID=T1FSI7_HELRO|nr:hypothetical protein HELRODRAFT_191032 [Helobdella robusta]ESO07758.1 hypothetical protein HELRODRAFT_191032 [Helobdella robusta]
MVCEYNGNLTVAVRSIIVKAWKERWTEEQWSRAMQSYMIYVESSKTFNVLLEQVMISSSPNVHILQYLKHALFSKMATFASAMKSVVGYEDVSQTFCISTLLKFVEELFPHILSSSHPVDLQQIPDSWVQLLTWLYTIISRTLIKLSTDSKYSLEMAARVLKMSSALLDKIHSNEISRAYVALSLAPSDNSPSNRSQKLEASTNEISRLLSTPTYQQLSEELKTAISSCLKHDFNPNYPVGPPYIVDFTRQNLNVCVNVLITMEAYLYRVNDLQLLADKLIALETLQGLPRSVLYCEILRSSFLGLLDNDVIPEDIKWSSFIFLKIPQLFQKMVATSKKDSEDEQSELYQGLKLLLDSQSLFVSVDYKCKCSSSLQSLLNELVRYSLLSEASSKDIIFRRQKDWNASSCNTIIQSLTNEALFLIQKAEPTATTILKSLDITKNQDLLLNVMTQMMSGKSFELISSAAGAIGKLQNFVMKLIIVNESSKTATGETGKNSQTRAALFDISFLMLCHIVQFFGIEIISSCPEGSNSFFFQWATRCLPDKHDQFKLSSLQMNSDPFKVEFVLSQLTGPEFKTSLVKWNEMCCNSPQAIQESLVLWEYNIIDDELMRQILDSAKGTMCCLMVVIATWLCSLYNVSGEDRQQRCCKMLAQLLQPRNPSDSVVNFSERNQLAKEFVYYVADLTLPPSALSNIANMLQQKQQLNGNTTLPNHQPPFGKRFLLQQTQPQQYSHTIFTLKEKILACHELPKLFSQTLNSAYRKNSIGVRDLLHLKEIYRVAGSQWFITQMVKDITKLDKPEDVERLVCLYHSLCHLDMKSLTVNLIDKVIPNIMTSSCHLKSLMDPWGTGIAKLCTLNVATLYKMATRKVGVTDGDSSGSNDKKRPWNDSTSDDNMETPSKIKKEAASQDVNNKNYSSNAGAGFNALSLTDDFLFSDQREITPMNDSPPSSSTSPSSSFLDDLSDSLACMFLMFQPCVTGTLICPRTGFALAFIKESLKLDRDCAQFILHNLPSSMVPQLMRYLNSDITPHHIFTMVKRDSPSWKYTISRALHNYSHYKQQQLQL